MTVRVPDDLAAGLLGGAVGPVMIEVAKGELVHWRPPGRNLVASGLCERIDAIRDSLEEGASVDDVSSDLGVLAGEVSLGRFDSSPVPESDREAIRGRFVAEFPDLPDFDGVSMAEAFRMGYSVAAPAPENSAINPDYARENPGWRNVTRVVEAGPVAEGQFQKVVQRSSHAPEIKVGQPEITDRGFKHWPAIEAGVAVVRVYESSAASRPHLWLRVAEEKVEAVAHLPLWEAQCVADTIYAAIRNHYQVEPSPPAPSLDLDGLARLDDRIAFLGGMAKHDTYDHALLRGLREARELLVKEAGNDE